MPRTGAYSKGCQSCKLRRIKCDLKRPTCERCLIGRKECVYKDEFDIRLRDETQHAAQVATKKWRQRSKSTLQPSDESTTEENAVSYLVKTHSPRGFNVSPSATPGLQDQAVCRFFFDHVHDPNKHASRTGFYPGFLEFLPEKFASAAPDSALYTATCAVAFADLSGRSKAVVPRTYAVEKYGQALKLVNAALQDPAAATSDDTLISIYLLGIYEIINCEKILTGGYGGWKKHAEGALLLLSLRGEVQNQTEIGLRLTSLVLVHTVTSCLTWRHRPSVPIQDWTAILKPMNVGFQLTRLMYMTAEALGNAMDAKVQYFNEKNHPLINSALRRLRVLDQELEDFMSKMPHDRHFPEYPWPPANLPEWAESFINLPGHPQNYHVYPVINFAAWWNMYRTTRLIINQTIVEILHEDDLYMLEYHIDNNDPTSETSISREVIAWAIEEICASVPAHLTLPIEGKPGGSSIEDVCGLRGFLLVWPSFMVERVLTLFPESWLGILGKKAWIKNLMRHLETDLSVSAVPQEFLRGRLGPGNWRT